MIGSGLSGNAPYATPEVVTSTCPIPTSAAASSTLWVPFTSTSYMNALVVRRVQDEREVHEHVRVRSLAARAWTAPRSRTSTRSNSVFGR